MTDAANLLTEEEAVAWLSGVGIRASLRTLRDMRAKREISYHELKRGTPKIRFTVEQIKEAFIGEEISRTSGALVTRKQAASAKSEATLKTMLGAKGSRR